MEYIIPSQTILQLRFITLSPVEVLIFFILKFFLLQTSFGHISINSLTILMVLMATESLWKDISIYASHVSRQSILAKILSRSTGNHYVTIY